MGTTYVETGLLLTENGWPVLAFDGGGRWRLFLERDARDLLGQRVTLRGLRYGFDQLHVSAIAKGFEAPPEPRRWL